MWRKEWMNEWNRKIRNDNRTIQSHRMIMRKRARKQTLLLLPASIHVRFSWLHSQVRVSSLFLSGIISCESRLECMRHASKVEGMCMWTTDMHWESQWLLPLIYLSEKFIVCLEVMPRSVSQTNVTWTLQGKNHFYLCHADNTKQRYSFYVPFFNG